MGRNTKKLLIGGGVAIIVFLAVIFLFGDEPRIQLSFAHMDQNLSPELKTFAGPQQNLTQALSQRLATRILNANPNGPMVASGTLAITLTHPNALIQEALASEMQSFDPQELDPIIDTAKFNVVNTTNASIAAYFKIFPSIFNPALFSAPTDPNINTNEYITNVLSQLDDAYKKIASLPVPSDLTNIHLQALLVIGKQRNIIALVKNSDQDPLRALLAVQSATKVHDDLIALQNSIDAYRGSIKK